MKLYFALLSLIFPLGAAENGDKCPELVIHQVKATRPNKEYYQKVLKIREPWLEVTTSQIKKCGNNDDPQNPLKLLRNIEYTSSSIIRELSEEESMKDYVEVVTLRLDKLKKDISGAILPVLFQYYEDELAETTALREKVAQMDKQY